MKKSFLKFDKRSLLKFYNKFSSKDKDIIENFLVFCGSSAGRSTISKYRAVLIKITYYFDGNLDKIDLDTLRSFLNILNHSELLPATKNEIRKVLKRFLREFYDDWSLRFKGLRDIRCESDINQDRINGNTILKFSEIEALVRSADFKYKSLIMLFYETAGRPEEILKLKWKDIDLDRGEVKLFSSKTGNLRINPIQNSVYHLKVYKENYPYVNLVLDDFLFPSPVNRFKQISKVSVSSYFKRLGLKVLKKDIFLYLIRHTRATELQKVLPAKIYEKFMDHSIETATRYSHLNKDDVREVMFKNVYKVNEVTNKKEIEERIEYLENSVKNLLKIIEHLETKS